MEKEARKSVPSCLTFAGTYRLEVRSIRDRPLGSYRITLALRRSRNRSTSNKAEQLVAEAAKFCGGPAGIGGQRYRQVSEAKALVELTNNLQMKAVVLNLIGRGHYVLGDRKQIAEFHNQAFGTGGAVPSGDQFEEAETLARPQSDLSRSISEPAGVGLHKSKP